MESQRQAIYKMTSVGAWELRIVGANKDTGSLTVEKRHKEELLRLNPTVTYYKGYLVSNAEEMKLFTEGFYNPAYSCYIFNPLLCVRPTCGKPVSPEREKFKTRNGRFPQLCADHLKEDFAHF